MKALTVYQPWATALAVRVKKYETRSRRILYRGPVAIHAGLRHINCFPEGFSEALHEQLKAALPGFTYMHELPHGFVIATAELVGCHEITISHDDPRQPCVPLVRLDGDWILWPVGQREQMLGDWTPGRYAVEFADMKMLPEPIPARGYQGLWNWEPPEGVGL